MINTAKVKSRSFRILIYFFIIVFLVINLSPFLWMFSTSLKPEHKTTEFPPRIIPSEITFENYERVFTVTQVPRFILNTFYVSVISIMGVIFIGSFAAYGFSRYEFKYKSTLQIAMLASIMISGVTIIVPLYIVFLKLNILNTYIALFIVYVTQALPISVWLLKAHFDTLPKALDDAAMIDGCSSLGTLVRVILPLSKPGIIAASLYTLVVAYKEFILANTFVTKIHLKTIPIGVYQFFTELGIEWGKLSATVIISTIPAILMFLFFQQYFNPGGISSGIK